MFCSRRYKKRLIFVSNMEVIEFIDSLFFRKATWIWLNFVCVRQIIYTKYLVVSKTSFTFAPRKGEVLEWLKRHAWKACIPQKGIRGSNPLLSAIKGVNQAFARFTPFFTPKNAIRTKLGSGNIPFIGYFVITTLIQTKYPQKISTNNYNKN